MPFIMLLETCSHLWYVPGPHWPYHWYLHQRAARDDSCRAGQALVPHHNVPSPSLWKAAILRREEVTLADGGLHPQRGVPHYCHLLLLCSAAECLRASRLGRLVGITPSPSSATRAVNLFCIFIK